MLRLASVLDKLVFWVGLLYYAVSNIKDVASMESFIQTEIIDVSPKQRFVDFPDIIICTAGYDIGFGGVDEHNSIVDTFENASVTLFDTDSYKFIRVTPKATKIIRNDIWGV
ncbi:hypothetical protein BGZ65_007186 [Modicella reniformis]|uniref:Uncharacterized protein n=1 Tax=Modicella reniformis TaxID=1440133 RepID=A0A9P6M8C6_9FUNG|nr:hypothetical protein BGZ65_007186 [Modicella reniformis]